MKCSVECKKAILLDFSFDTLVTLKVFGCRYLNVIRNETASLLRALLAEAHMQPIRACKQASPTTFPLALGPLADPKKAMLIIHQGDTAPGTHRII